MIIMIWIASSWYSTTACYSRMCLCFNRLTSSDDRQTSYLIHPSNHHPRTWPFITDTIQYSHLKNQGPNSQKLRINLSMFLYRKLHLSLTWVYHKFMRIRPQSSQTTSWAHEALCHMLLALNPQKLFTDHSLYKFLQPLRICIQYN